MTLDWISQPVDDQTPAGEDLFEIDDAAYGDYYFDSVGRLPEADDFFRPGMEVGGNKQPDVIFDPKSVTLKDELTAIDGLLKRSRDIRLLVLRTQWAILSGDLRTSVESVEAIAGLLEAMPNEAHPQLTDGPRDRLDALNDLSQIGAMILPLRYLDLAGSGASLRQVLVAKGRYTPHDGEHDLMLDPLLKMLGSMGDALESVHGLLAQFKAAVERIEMSCLGHDTPHTPQVKTLKDELDAILSLLAEVRPELSDAQADADTENEAVPGLETPPQMPGVAAPTGGASVWVEPVTEVKSHDEARARLIAVESYFSLKEPSSAAVLLITQARLLIGKTLIDAFEELMPNAVDRAVVEFTPALDFKLARGQLRTLADQVEKTEGDTGESHTSGDGDSNAAEIEIPGIAANSSRSYKVNNPEEAKAQISAVETFFRMVEKSSPVPLLLSRARGYIGKDFETLMREFIPKDEY